MTNTEFFCEALHLYIQSPSYESALTLSRACGKIWQDGSQVPISARSDIGVAIKSHIDFDQWEANGRTYAGAAHRIRPDLNREYSLS